MAQAQQLRLTYDASDLPDQGRVFLPGYHFVQNQATDGAVVYYGGKDVTSSSYTGTVAAGETSGPVDGAFWIAANGAPATIYARKLTDLEVAALLSRSDVVPQRIEAYGGSPLKSGTENLAALIEADAAAARDAALYGYGIVEFGIGAYPWTPDLTSMPGPSAGVTWRGQGKDLTSLVNQTPTVAMFRTGRDNWRIENLTLDGHGDTLAGATGQSCLIVDSGASDWSVSGVRVKDPGNNGIQATTVSHFQIDVWAEDVGLYPATAATGGHAVTIAGDNTGDPRDSFDGLIKVRGRNVVNGVVNVGQADGCHIEVDNDVDYDPTDSPYDSFLAAVRVSNGSENITGYVNTNGAGRALRIGPNCHVTMDFSAKNSAHAPVLIVGGTFGDGGWKGRDITIRGRCVDCCQTTGAAAVYVVGATGANVYLDAENTPDVITLKSNTTTTDPDFGTEVPISALRLIPKSGNRVPYKVTVAANGGNLDFTVTTDDENATVVETYTTTTGSNNDDLAATINATSTVFDAYVPSDAGVISVATVTNQKGCMAWGILNLEWSAALTANLAADVGAVTATLDEDELSSLITTATGETNFPWLAELRDDTAGRKETVLVTANPSSTTLTIDRAENLTTALAWTTAANARLYGHLSRWTDLGGDRLRLHAGPVSVFSPYGKVVTQAINTDMSSRLVAAATLTVPFGRDQYRLADPSVIPVTNLIGRYSGRTVQLVADVAGTSIVHGNNIQLYGGRDWVSVEQGDTISFRVDEHANKWVETSPRSRTLPRVVAAGNIGAAYTLALVKGDQATMLTATLTDNATITVTGLQAGSRFYAKLTQDGTGSRTVAFSPAAKVPGAAGFTLSAAAGRTDVLELWSPDGTNLYGSVVGLNWA